VKAIGIVGSPRKGGNTEILVRHTLKAIEEEGLDTELVTLGDKDIKTCNACMACKKGEETCPIKDDLWPIYLKMKESDAIIIGTPVYFSSATALIKAFTERTGYIGRPQDAFKGKVGGPVVVARRAEQNFAHAELAYWFHINEIIVPGSNYWNVAFGTNEGDVESDEEGLKTVRHFGKNVADLVKKLRA